VNSSLNSLLRTPHLQRSVDTNGSIPAVWELIRKSIEGRIAEAGPIVRTLFWAALGAKDRMMRYGIPGTFILDAIVLNKVKDATGGHILWSMYGGSALSEETQRFICAAICPIASGYGLTETSAMGALSTPAIWSYGYTGALETCVEAKLVDVPDLGYFTTNDPPQGEVWLRGPSITSGYLDREAETKALFAEGGWLKTGDIGQFGKRGELKIIDRVKNLVKTLNGEYIAIEKVPSTPFCSC
jgi:long-chain acyl-CoA synthetase